MNTSEVLKKLELGSWVAEFDKDIERHFVVTESFRALVGDKADIVAGDKGAGKTTIYKYLRSHYTTIPELSKVEIVTGFNPAGNPVFQRLAQTNPLSEGYYLSIWKTYVLSLIGNWLLQLCEGSYQENTRKLDDLLNKIGLRSTDDSAETIFSRVAGLTHKLLNPKRLGVGINVDQTGTITYTPQIDLAESKTDPSKIDFGATDIDKALDLLESALVENDISVWMLLDRLDEAFVGYPEIEQPALRALLRVYLDSLAFERIVLKLFVRRDLIKKVTRGGFVNLTHINARKTEILWDTEDLFSLLCRRIKGNDEFLRLTNTSGTTNQGLFLTLFSERITSGERQPATWNWILTHLKDGKGFVAPRNLIELVSLARDEQLRREQRNERPFVKGVPLIETESLKRALSRLSERRVEDTLLAEVSKEVATLIEGFRGSRFEHDDDSIARLFGVKVSQAKEFAETLVDIGFLERAGPTYKIPILYRDGLAISRNKDV